MRAGQERGKGAGEDITRRGATKVRGQGECVNLVQMAHYVLGNKFCVAIMAGASLWEAEVGTSTQPGTLGGRGEARGSRGRVVERLS